MPAYSATGDRVVIYPGDSQTVWNAETPLSGTASQQVALSVNNVGGPKCFSVQTTFASDPGTYEIDVQLANAPDVANNYWTTTSKITNSTDNASFTGRLDIVDVEADFVRLLMATQSSNAVTVTATITR